MSLPRDLSTTIEDDIRALVAARTAEGTYLEFKRDLPHPDAGGRHEFLADVSAFANSGGGDLVYGIDEDGEGRATAFVAQAGNADDEVRRLQDVLLNGIEPRVPGLQVQAVVVAGGFVVIVRAPQSWAGPHRVKSNSTSSFVRMVANDSLMCRKSVASSCGRKTKHSGSEISVRSASAS